MQNMKESYLPNMLKSFVKAIPIKDITNFSDAEMKAYDMGIENCIQILHEILEQNKANILDE